MNNNEMEPVKDSAYRAYQGGYFRTLIAPQTTGNKLAALEFTLPKGAEPPPHVHVNEDESFFVLYGRISVIVGDTVTILEKGDALFAPRNIPHAFTILTEQATLINLITPGTLWNYFIAFSEPLPELPATLTASPPPANRLKMMLQQITDVYQVNFLHSLK